MDKKRQAAVYRKLSSPHPHGERPSPQTERHDPSYFEKTRNPCTHYAEGYSPNGSGKPPHKRHILLRSKVFYAVVLVILLTVFAYASYQITIYIIQTNRARQVEQLVQEIITENEPDAAAAETVQMETIATPSPAPAQAQAAAVAVTAAPTQTPKPEALIQFTQALAINPDTVGQLEMGESISTYVVQRDNSYYLRHSFYGEYSFSGAIFLDVSCSINPQSRNLIIHGHNMQNGTSFGKLSRFEDVDYLNQYPIIYFSTLYESAEYRPFAVVYYSIDSESEDYLNLYRVNYLSDDEFIEFVHDIQLRSVYHIPVNVAKTDKILTITTCATDDPDIRFAVFAVKLKEQ